MTKLQDSSRKDKSNYTRLMVASYLEVPSEGS